VRTGGALKLSPGTLYRSIDRMVLQGLIREISSRPARDMDDERRRYYRITPFGREVAMAESRRLAQMLALARARGLAPRKVGCRSTASSSLFDPRSSPPLHA